MLSLNGYSSRSSLLLILCCTLLVVYEGNIMTVFNYLKDGYNSSFNRFYQENSGVVMPLKKDQVLYQELSFGNILD